MITDDIFNSNIFFVLFLELEILAIFKFSRSNLQKSNLLQQFHFTISLCAWLQTSFLFLSTEWNRLILFCRSWSVDLADMPKKLLLSKHWVVPGQLSAWQILSLAMHCWAGLQVAEFSTLDATAIMTRTFLRFSSKRANLKWKIGPGTWSFFVR